MKKSLRNYNLTCPVLLRKYVDLCEYGGATFLDFGIDEGFAKAVAKEKPLRIVFKDSGFKNDTAKENVKQLLKQLSPDTEMKVL